MMMMMLITIVVVVYNLEKQTGHLFNLFLC